MPDWDREVLPVLRAVHAGIQRDSAGGAAGFFTTDAVSVNQILGRGENDQRTTAMLMELRETDYINCEVAMGGGAFNIRLTEKGSQHVAGWPMRPGDDIYGAIISVLDDRIARAEAEERTALEKFRDGVVAVGQGVVTGVLTDVARRGL